MSIGLPEILFILLIVLLVFGAKRIPEIAKALGRASYEFKKAKSELKKETDALIQESEKLAETGAQTKTKNEKKTDTTDV